MPVSTYAIILIISYLYALDDIFRVNHLDAYLFISVLRHFDLQIVRIGCYNLFSNVVVGWFNFKYHNSRGLKRCRNIIIIQISNIIFLLNDTVLNTVHYIEEVSDYYFIYQQTNRIHYEAILFYFRKL